MIEEKTILQEALDHPSLLPYKKEIEEVMVSLASGLPDWMFFANTYKGACCVCVRSC